MAAAGFEPATEEKVNRDVAQVLGVKPEKNVKDERSQSASQRKPARDAAYSTITLPVMKGRMAQKSLKVPPSVKV